MAQGTDRRYFYSGTDVPINKFGIRDPTLYKSYEESALVLRAIELSVQPPKLTFDTEHVKQIHGRIHRDLFSWAGAYRTMPHNPRRRDDGTAQRLVDQIVDSQGAEIMQDVKRLATQPVDDKERFVERLTSSFVQLRKWSPFALGNDATMRILVTQAADKADYALQWNKTQPETFDHAMTKALNQDYTALRAEFRTMSVPLMAVAFSEAIEKKSAGSAVFLYPQLLNAFETLRQAEAILSEDRGDQATRAKRYNHIVERMTRELTEGRIPPEPTEKRLRQLLWFTRAFTRSA